MLRAARLLCGVTMAVAMYLIVFSQYTVFPWVLALVGGPGSALVQWRASKGSSGETDSAPL
jgi:uncharacterized membrane protein YdfJ with MMPL/SSD domain